MIWSHLVTACAAISLGWLINRQSQQLFVGPPLVAPSLCAQEFVLVGADGKTCARIGLDSQSDQPHVQLFNHRNGRKMLDLGVDFMGAATVSLGYNGSSPSPGAEIIIENLGDPGVPTVRLLGQQGPTRPEIRISISSVGKPEITFTERDGTSTSLVPVPK